MKEMWQILLKLHDRYMSVNGTILFMRIHSTMVPFYLLLNIFEIFMINILKNQCHKYLALKMTKNLFLSLFLSTVFDTSSRNQLLRE